MLILGIEGFFNFRRIYQYAHYVNGLEKKVEVSYGM